MTQCLVPLGNERRLRTALNAADEHGDTVLIDRRAKWGTPFRPGGDRDTAIAFYRAEL